MASHFFGVLCRTDHTDALAVYGSFGTDASIARQGGALLCDGHFGDPP